jgi:hypothetical protein
MVAAGVIGALVALLIGYGLQAGGILPAPGGDTASAALQKANAASGAIAALDKRVADAESTLSGLKAASGDASGLAGRVTGLEADQKALADKVAGLGQAAPAESGTNGGADMSAVLDDLTARVDARQPIRPPSTASSHGLAHSRRRSRACRAVSTRWSRRNRPRPPATRRRVPSLSPRCARRRPRAAPSPATLPWPRRSAWRPATSPR